MWSGPNNSFEPTQQSGAAQFSRSAEMACGLFMKFRFVFALALFGCFARAVESGEPGLEHERIYASSGVELVAGPINRYLMFYPDGVVIGADYSQAITVLREMKRQGRVWIRIFPDVPVSDKPAEVRMGNGKGAIEYWAARVHPGRIMFEIDGVPDDVAREALRLGAAKLPVKTRIVAR